MKLVHKIQSDDRVQNQFQQVVIDSVNPVISNPVTDGLIIPGVDVGTSQTVINHRLNRTLQGWLIVRKRSAGDVYDQQATNPNTTKTLILTSSAPVNIDIYVF